MIVQALTHLTYLVAAALFIYGLKLLSSPKTARRGNLLAAVGMLLAVLVTLLDRQIVSFTAIVAGMVVGGAVGLVFAWRVRMTAMPQMVALFNGFGGAASALVSLAELLRVAGGGSRVPAEAAAAMALGLLIGGVTFSGSMVAFGKLQELIPGRPIQYPNQHSSNLALFLFVLLLMAGVVAGVAVRPLGVLVLLLSLALGVLLVLPIGGADMPVVISLLNSYSGLAGSAAGFVVGNNILIIAGALVGASGIILTNLMCRAMNRSLVNVVLGGFGAAAGVGSGAGAGAGGRAVREVTVEDAAILLAYARSVIFVPGYGLAVAQAQHQVRELADLLESRGVQVRYAIHPVAGRMPGHMNVLLAEANVPYEKLYDLEQINPEFERTDVAVVIGANDVVNPAARSQPGSPLYGMPILDVDRARHVLVLKRSMNPGFAGIENELFYKENTMMLFGDARQSLTGLIQEVKAAA